MRRRERERARVREKGGGAGGGGIFKPMWRVVGGGVMLASAGANANVDAGAGRRREGGGVEEDAVLAYQPRDGGERASLSLSPCSLFPFPVLLTNAV
jgi:hypothetical protein